MGLLGRSLGRHGTGYLPDQTDPRDLDIDRLGLASRQLPITTSLRPRGLVPFDQGRTNSCVGNAIAQAVRIRQAHRAGWELPEPLSRLAIYWNARAYHGGTTQDLGTHIRMAIRGLQHYGAPPEHVWPFDIGVLGKVNRKPSLRSYQLGHDFGGVRGYYRIFDSGERKLLAIKSAIAAGYPVVAGWLVDAEFQRDDGPSVIDVVTGPTIGGHAGVLDGYAGDAFDFVNSWGTSWRAGGVATVTSGFVERAIDVWAVDC